MKKYLLVTVLAVAMLSCKQKAADSETNATTDTIKSSTATAPEVQPTAEAVLFDMDKIAVTDKFTGTFPYIKMPAGYALTDPNKYHGKGVVKDVDREYFYNGGYYFPIDGKSYKAVMRVDENTKDKTFSKLELQKSIDKFVADAGGVTINNGKALADGELDRLKTEVPNAYIDGYLHSANNYDDVHTYVLRTKEKTVFIQYNLGSESANITVLEMEAAE